MKPEHACECVNSLATSPMIGYEAEPHTHRYEDAIKVRVTVLGGTDSNADQAPTYSTPINPCGPRADFVVYVGDCATPADLVAKVLEITFDVIEHELREFTRYEAEDGRWIAPYHPHKREGIEAWAERTGGDPRRDYTYGVA